jgi:4-hydroxybenzoate polyprenyltransferase
MKILSYYRVSGWYYYLGYIVLGFLLKSPLNIEIIKHILLGSFLLAYAFSFNNFYDKREKRKFFILPLILSFLFLPLFNIFQIIISLIFLIIVTFYSLHPFRWKAKPFISSLYNGFGFTLIFLLGYFVTPTFEIGGLLFSVLFFCFNMVAQFIHEIVHKKIDKKNNIITTVVFCGESAVKKFCFFLFALSLFISLYLCYLRFINPLTLFVTILYVIKFTIILSRKKIDKKVRSEYKVLGIIVGLFYIINFI